MSRKLLIAVAIVLAYLGGVYSPELKGAYQRYFHGEYVYTNFSPNGTEYIFSVAVNEATGTTIISFTCLPEGTERRVLAVSRTGAILQNASRCPETEAEPSSS